MKYGTRMAEVYKNISLRDAQNTMFGMAMECDCLFLHDGLCELLGLGMAAGKLPDELMRELQVSFNNEEQHPLFQNLPFLSEFSRHMQDNDIRQMMKYFSSRTSRVKYRIALIAGFVGNRFTDKEILQIIDFLMDQDRLPYWPRIPIQPLCDLSMFFRKTHVDMLHRLWFKEISDEHRRFITIALMTKGEYLSCEQIAAIGECLDEPNYAVRDSALRILEGQNEKISDQHLQAVCALITNESYRREAVRTAVSMWARLNHKQKAQILELCYKADSAVFNADCEIGNVLDEKAKNAMVSRLIEERDRFRSVECMSIVPWLNRQQIKGIIPVLIDYRETTGEVDPDRFLPFSAFIDGELNNYIMNLFDSSNEFLQKVTLALLYNPAHGTVMHVSKLLKWFMKTWTAGDYGAYRKLKECYALGLLYPSGEAHV